MRDAPASRGTAVVTGGRRGIGGAVALRLQQSGFQVAVVDSVEDDDGARTMQALARCDGRSMFVRADIADVAGHAGWLRRVTDTLGPIACLVNNAGVNVPVRGDMLDATADAFDRVVGVNLRGTFFLTQAVARHMAATPAGGPPRTVFIVSSANAAMVSPEKAVYCLSKSALSMAMALYAARLAEYGIDVFEIQPGLIKTRMNEAVWQRYGQAIDDGISLTRRWGLPEDVAQVIASVATGALPFCTGTTIPVGGGLHVHRL